ncbi:MAG: hypothetical protein HOV73_08455 [Streptomyces sp.]|nr:hypothetical protein [Streptomyces sp.]
MSRVEPVAAVHTGTARRAVETADIIAKGFDLDLPVRHDHGLIEYGVGVLERSSGSAAGHASQDVLRRWFVGGSWTATLTRSSRWAKRAGRPSLVSEPRWNASPKPTPGEPSLWSPTSAR